MWRHTVLITGIGMAMAAQSAFATPKSSAHHPYEGVWASNQAACRDQDGVDRMQIAGDEFQWYEAHCRATGVRKVGANSWTMRMACQGEGQRSMARPRITLASPDRLAMAHGPVGPGKGPQTYVRCAAK